MAVSENGRYVVAGCLDTMVYFWDNESGSGEPLEGHKRKVRAVAISPDGRFALSGSEENELRYWDLAQAKELRSSAGTRKERAALRSHPTAGWAYPEALTAQRGCGTWSMEIVSE